MAAKSGADHKFLTLNKGNLWGTRSFYLFKALNNLGVMTWFWLDIDRPASLKLGSITHYWRWNFCFVLPGHTSQSLLQKAGPPTSFLLWARAICEGPVASISSRHWTTWEWSHGVVSKSKSFQGMEQLGSDDMVWVRHWSAKHIESLLPYSVLVMEFGFVLPGPMSQSWLQKSRVDQKFLTLSKGNPWGTSSFYLFNALNKLGVLTWFWLDIDWPATLNPG